MCIENNFVEQAFSRKVIKDEEQIYFGFKLRDKKGELVTLTDANVHVRVLLGNKNQSFSQKAIVSNEYIIIFSIALKEIISTENIKVKFTVNHKDGKIEHFPSHSWKEIIIHSKLTEEHDISLFHLEKVISKVYNQFKNLKSKIIKRKNPPNNHIDNLINFHSQTSEIVNKRIKEKAISHDTARVANDFTRMNNKIDNLSDFTIDGLLENAQNSGKINSLDIRSRSLISSLQEYGINPKDFGALGNANYRKPGTNQWFADKAYNILANDDTISLQNAIEYAYVNNLKKVNIPAGNYLISNTLYYYSETTISGAGRNKTILKMTGINKPILVTKGYLDKLEPTGHGKLHDFSILGDQSQPLNKGLIIRDFYSEIFNITVSETGGNGIEYTHLSLSGTSVNGNLVENLIKNIVIRNCMGISFKVGDPNNNKLTDGIMRNIIIWQPSGNINKAISIGSSAGWTIDGIHTYGSVDAECAVEFLNGYYTNINNIYIEAFKNLGIYLGASQRAINLTNISFNTSSCLRNADCIRIEISKAFNSAEVNISNISIINSVNQVINGISCFSEAITVNCVNVNVGGDYSSLVNKYKGINRMNMKRMSNLIIDGRLVDTETKTKLSYEGMGLSYADSKLVSGAGIKSIIFKLPKIISYDKVIGDIFISASSYDNGVLRATWRAMIMVSAKSNQTNSYTVYVTPIILPNGFLMNPNISIDKLEDFGEITVTFSYANTDSSGIVGLILTPPTY